MAKLESEEQIDDLPTKPARRGGSGPGCLVVAGLTLTGVVFGYHIGATEAAALTFSNSVGNRRTPPGVIYGFAIGNRWRTHDMLSQSMQDILVQVDTPYQAEPSDNPFFDIKHRLVVTPEFTSSGRLVEIGDMQLRFEEIITSRDTQPRNLEFHSS